MRLWGHSHPSHNSWKWSKPESWKWLRAQEPQILASWPFIDDCIVPVFSNHGVFFPFFQIDIAITSLYICRMYVFAGRSEDSLRYQSLSVTLLEARSLAIGHCIFQNSYPRTWWGSFWLCLSAHSRSARIQMHTAMWFLESQLWFSLLHCKNFYPQSQRLSPPFFFLFFSPS